MASLTSDEAERLRKQAEKKLTGFNLFGSKAKRMEEAAELYARSAAKFRVAKHWDEAAETHMMAAHNFKTSSNENWVEARKNYEEAAKCFRKCKPEDSVPAYREAAEISVQENSFSLAGKLFKSLGEVIEEEQLGVSEAMEAYRRAADCFETEDAERNQNEMLVKVAFLSAKQELYDDAIELYDKVARSAKGASRQISDTCMFNATACRLASSSCTSEKAENDFEEYKEISPSLERSRSGKLLDALFDAIREADLDMWDQAISDYTSKEDMSEFIRSLFSQARERKLEDAALGGDIDLS